jgi:hypothetical protein
MDCEILSRVPVFEIAHPQDMASEQPQNIAGLSPETSFLILLPTPDSNGEIVLSSFSFLSPGNTTLVLRC